MQIFAWGSSYYLMAVLAGPISEDTGWPLPWVVGALSLGLLVAGLASPGVGRAIARHGGRPVLLAGCLLLALGLVMLALATALWVFLLGWAVIGLGMAAGLYDPAFATLGALYGREARRAITTLTLWGGFASTVCWPLSALLLEHLGWRGAALAYAGLHLCLSAPLILWLVPPAPATGGPKPRAQPISLAPEERRSFLLMAAILTLAGLATTILSVHLLTLLAARGLSLSAAVAIGALIGPAQVGGRLIEMASGGRHPVIWSLAAATVSTAAGLVLLALVDAPAPAMLLYGAGNGVFSIARGALPMAVFGPERYPALMGRLARPALLAQAAAPLIGAALITRLGAEATLAALAAFALANVILALTLWTGLRQPSAAGSR